MNRYSRWGSFFKRFFLQDTGRKAMALLLAVILYGNVTYKSKDIHSRQISGVKVDLVLPPDVVNAQGNVLSVQLKVSGSERVLNRLTPESFGCKVEPGLGDIQPDQLREVELTASHFQKPFGVSIESISPAKLNLQLDRVITRKLPIRQVFDSEDRLPFGYAIRGVSVQPGEIAVTGPSGVVNGLQQVRTMPVPVDGTTREGFDFVAGLQKLDGVRMTPDRVTLRVEIGRRADGERSMSALPFSLLLTQDQRRRFSAVPGPGEPAAADVVVRGPDEARNALQKNGLRIFVDLSDLQKPGEYVLPLAGVFMSPEAQRSLQIVRIQPEKIRIIVTQTASENIQNKNKTDQK